MLSAFQICIQIFLRLARTTTATARNWHKRDPGMRHRTHSHNPTQWEHANARVANPRVALGTESRAKPLAFVLRRVQHD